MIEPFLRFPGGKSRALTLSYDDGVDTDIRLLEIMQKNGIKGTFNINSGLYPAADKVWPPEVYARRLPLERSKEVYASPNAEVAVHGVKHAFLKYCPPQIQINEVLEDRRNLEKHYGGIIRGMAYAYGAYNAETLNTLKNCGIAYARTTNSTFNFELPTNWLEWHPTCHHLHDQFPALVDQFLTDAPRPMPRLFYLWGHAHEFERDNNWELIEENLEKLGGHQDVWYATNIEIYDYITAFRSLKYSVESDVVYNPSAIDVWMWSRHDKKLWHIPAGQTVELK